MVIDRWMRIALSSISQTTVSAGDLIQTPRFPHQCELKMELLPRFVLSDCDYIRTARMTGLRGLLPPSDCGRNPFNSTLLHLGTAEHAGAAESHWTDYREEPGLFTQRHKSNKRLNASTLAPAARINTSQGSGCHV